MFVLCARSALAASLLRAGLVGSVHLVRVHIDLASLYMEGHLSTL